MSGFVSTTTRRHLLVAAGFGLAAIALYIHSIGYPFVFDDKHNILENQAIRVTHLDWSSVKTALVHSPCEHRPVANLSFAVTYMLAGYQPAAYRAVNIAIHCAAGVLVYFFIWQTLTVLARQRRHPPDREPAVAADSAWAVAFVAAVIWLVHPIQVSAVVYIVQRMTSLCALFYLGALVLYIHARTTATTPRSRVLGYAGSVVCGIAALGTKEIAATLPAAVFLYEWIILQRTRFEFLRRYKWFFLAMLAALGAVSLLYLGSSPLHSVLSGYDIRPFTLTERVMTEWRIIVFYLTLLIAPLPRRLALDHYFAPSTSLMQPLTTLGALVFILAAVAAAVWLTRRWRLLGFCILWYFLHLAIESTVIPLELVFEHRLYLPSIGVILPVIVLGHTCLPDKRMLRTAIVSVAAVMLAAGTWIYSQHWQSRLALATHSIEVSPRKSRPYSTRALALAKRGRLQAALSDINHAQKLRPRLPTLFYNEGKILAQSGHDQQAADQFRKTLDMAPAHLKALVGLGAIHARQGRYREAAQWFSRALEQNPDNVRALMYRAKLYEKYLDRPDKARAAYEKAAEALEKAGRGARAEQVRQKARDLGFDAAGGPPAPAQPGPDNHKPGG